MPRILIPTPLRPYTDKQDAVDVAGATVGELLADLTRKHSGLKTHLYNDQGKLRSFVNVYVNDEDIRYLQKEQTLVHPGDTISIIPSVAGGVSTVESGFSSTSQAETARELPTLTNDEIKRYSRHLIMPEVVVGTDNFPTRYLVNDACVLLGKPNAYGSIFRFEGQASVFGLKDGPCYRCLYPEPPPPGLVPSCAEGGVLGVLPGVIGTIQAMETIKLILGIG